MRSKRHQWGLPLTFEEVSRAWQECVMCSKRDLHQVPQQHGTIVKEPILLIRWQIDYIGPLPVSEWYQYAMICVDTDTRFLVAFPTHCAVQQTTKRGLENLFTTYGWPQVNESDQGTHFAGHILQEWVQQLGIQREVHVPYNPTTAGMIERHNGLLKSGLKSDTNSLRLWTVLRVWMRDPKRDLWAL